jgi:hypothetical protein
MKAKLTANACAAQREISEKTKKPAGAWLELRPKQQATSTSSFPVKINARSKLIATKIALPSMSGNNRSRSNSGVNLSVSPTSVTALGCWHHGSQSDLASLVKQTDAEERIVTNSLSNNNNNNNNNNSISDAFRKYFGEGVDKDIAEFDNKFASIPTELTPTQQASLETRNKTYYTSIELFRIHIMATPMFARIRDEMGVAIICIRNNSIDV